MPAGHALFGEDDHFRESVHDLILVAVSVPHGGRLSVSRA